MSARLERDDCVIAWHHLYAQLMGTVDATRPAFFLLEEVYNFLVTTVPCSRSRDSDSMTVRAVWAVVLPLLDLGYQVSLNHFAPFPSQTTSRDAPMCHGPPQCWLIGRLLMHALCVHALCPGGCAPDECCQLRRPPGPQGVPLRSAPDLRSRCPNACMSCLP